MNDRIMDLRGITRSEYYKSGILKECTLYEENIVDTTYGKLIPKFNDEEARQKHISSISFYESGAIKRIALENQTEIDTPIGCFPAELITFYECGAIKRLFPLNGKISGYWTEEDEAQLCEAFQFLLPVGAFKSKIVGFHLYESGKLKSLTLWPGQDIVLRTNAGLLPVRNGFALYEDGNVKSVEPAYPIKVNTPIGEIITYDNTAVTIHADENSLCFNEDGNISSLKTYSNISIFPSEGSHMILKPLMAPNTLEEESMIKIPLNIYFDREKVNFECMDLHWEYEYLTTKFVVINELFNPVDNACSSDCSNCSQCK